MIGAYVIIGLYGLTSSLVCTRYVVLGFWLLAILIQLFRRENIKQLSIGFLELLFLYVVSNAGLFAEVILGREGYVSHREEMVNASTPFFRTVFDIFVNDQYHTYACHRRLILPIVIFLVLYGIRYKKLQEDARKRYRIAAWGMAVLLAVALFYGVCRLEPVVAGVCDGLFRRMDGGKKPGAE